MGIVNLSRLPRADVTRAALPLIPESGHLRNVGHSHAGHPDASVGKDVGEQCGQAHRPVVSTFAINDDAQTGVVGFGRRAHGLPYLSEHSVEGPWVRPRDEVDNPWVVSLKNNIAPTP